MLLPCLRTVGNGLDDDMMAVHCSFSSPSLSPPMAAHSIRLAMCFDKSVLSPPGWISIAVVMLDVRDAVRGEEVSGVFMLLVREAEWEIDLEESSPRDKGVAGE